MKTILHYYWYEISDPEENKEYIKLCEKLKAVRSLKFSALGVASSDHYKKHIKPLDGQEITLETKHLFNNQWNTAPTETSENGLRVFDWEEPIYPNSHIKEGHWLEQTPEMDEIRRNTVKCGYCGKEEPAAKGYVFCPHCLGSEYLKESDLRLLRLVPIYLTWKMKVPELTEAEKAWLVPKYTDFQLKSGLTRDGKRIEAARLSIEKKFNSAKDEYAGLTWLLDNGVRTDNCIFYDHTGRFCFGWRNPVSAAVKSRLLDILVEFPFDYDIKAEEEAIA
jgi:hypothetical protein